MGPRSAGLGGLAVFLIHQALNASSFWRPYLCSLPKYVPLPAFYSPRKRAATHQILRPDRKDYFDKLLSIIQFAIDSRYNNVMEPLIAKYPGVFDAKKFTRTRWAWAMAIILSRTWGRYNAHV